MFALQGTSLAAMQGVLSAPACQQHTLLQHPHPRSFAAARSALVLPTFAAVAAAAPLLLAAVSYRGAPPPLALVLAAWRAGVLCAFAWTAGAHVLEVVFTEPVAFADGASPDPTRALLAGLRHPDPLVQVGGCLFWGPIVHET